MDLGDLKNNQDKYKVLHDEKKPNPSGRPSFKKSIEGEFKARKLEITQDQLHRLMLLKMKTDIQGLDHAVHLALNDLFDKNGV